MVRDVVWYKLIKAGVRGKILNVIQAMYNTIKSRVKFDNELSNDFVSCIGVRQGECLSPFLFSMYLNDIEKEFIEKRVDGLDIGMTKLVYCYMRMTLLYFQQVVRVNNMGLMFYQIIAVNGDL